MGKKLKYLINRLQQQQQDAFSSGYDRVAPTYHLWSGYINPYYHQLLNMILPLLPEKQNLKVLDLACGTGVLGDVALKYLQIEQLLGVDISQKMLDIARNRFHHRSEVQLIQQDAIAFLRETPREQFDLVLCGWALPYLRNRELPSLIRRVLRPGGMFALITNVRGTLYKLFWIYLKLMLKHPTTLNTPLFLKRGLPRGEQGIKHRFYPSFLSETMITHNIDHRFATPGALYNFLHDTGIIAGTKTLFKEGYYPEEEIITQIKKKLFDGERYTINHRFVSAVLRRV